MFDIISFDLCIFEPFGFGVLKMRSMIIALFGLSTIIMGCSGNIMGIEKTKNFQQQIPYRQEKKLVIINVNGGIKVNAKERSEFSTVTAMVKASGLTAKEAQDYLDKIEIRFDREGDEIHVETIYPKAWTMPGKARKPKAWNVDFTILVPDKLDVRCTNTNGDIEIYGSNANAVLQTTNGNVKVKDNTGEVDAVTVNGNTEIRNSQDYRITVRAATRNGNHVVDMPNAKQGNFAVSTTNGNIEMNLPSGTDPRIDIKTVNGNIKVFLGERLSSQVDCSTTNGEVKTNMVINTSTSVGGILQSKVIKGVVGGGFGNVKAVTTNGNITLDYGQAPIEKTPETPVTSQEQTQT